MSIPDFHVTILGSGSAIPLPDRRPAAQVIRHGNFNVLVDCGEGTQVRLRECHKKPFQIDLILVSHLHGDHVFGLPGLLSTMNHLGRQSPLTVMGPPGLDEWLETLGRLSALLIHFPLDIRELRPTCPTTIFTAGDLDIQAFPLVHRIPTVGYLFRERYPRVRFDKEEIRRRGLGDADLEELSARIASGAPTDDPDCGVLYHPVARAGYAYCSDTRYDPRLAAWVKDIPVLFHETTFLDELADLAFETGHSTAAQAGRLAAAAGVGWLITGHYSSRFKITEDFVREASLHFPRVLAGLDSQRYDLRELTAAASAASQSGKRI